MERPQVFPPQVLEFRQLPSLLPYPARQVAMRALIMALPAAKGKALLRNDEGFVRINSFSVTGATFFRWHIRWLSSALVQPCRERVIAPGNESGCPGSGSTALQRVLAQSTWPEAGAEERHVCTQGTEQQKMLAWSPVDSSQCNTAVVLMSQTGGDYRGAVKRCVHRGSPEVRGSSLWFSCKSRRIA